MILTLSASALTFLGITASVLFFPTIRFKKHSIGTYWIVALLGALIVLSFGGIPLPEVWKQLTADSAVNPLKILALFFSMTILSVYLDEAGMFRYLAKKAVAKAGNNQFALFSILFGLTSLLTVFTSNDVVILTLTPFIVFFARHAKVNPIPYLVAEFAAANTWSMMLLIGNPTNIYLSGAANIGFVDYLRVMALPTLLTGLVEYGLLLLLFAKQLRQPIEKEEDDYQIESKPDLIIGLIHLIVCLAFLVISGYVGIEMWMVSSIAALSMILCALVLHLFTHRHWQYLGDSFARLPYQLIPFVLSMFIIVGALNYQGISAKIGEFLGNSAPIWVYGSTSFLASNILNNIPMAVLFSNLPNGLSGNLYPQAIYATIIGSNLGAFLTPIGALAGIMFSSLLSRYDIHYGFRDFVKYGVLIALPCLAVALGSLQLVFALFPL